MVTRVTCPITKSAHPQPLHVPKISPIILSSKQFSVTLDIWANLADFLDNFILTTIPDISTLHQPKDQVWRSFKDTAIKYACDTVFYYITVTLLQINQTLTNIPLSIWDLYLLIYFRVASLVLGQSYDCPSASEVTLKYMDKIDQYQTTTKYDHQSKVFP